MKPKKWSKAVAKMAWWDAMGGFTLLILGLVVTAHLSSGLDIGLYDETDYLVSGVELLQRGLPRPDVAPLYDGVYFLLSFFARDRVALYFLNYRLWVVLPPLVMYWAWRRYQVLSPVAWVGSAAFLTSMFHVYGWPRVSDMALTMILFVLGWAATPRSRASVAFGAMVGALGVTYVRAEYALAFGVLALWWLWEVRHDHEWLRQHSILVFGVVAGVGALWTIWGVPFLSGRLQIAFRQHFAVNWAQWHQSTIDPWTHADVAWQSAFGDAKGMIEAALRNPLVVERHVQSNIVQLFMTIPRLFPASTPDFPLLRRVFMAWLLLVGCAYFWRERREFGKQLRLIWVAPNKVVWAAFLLPGVGTSLLIYPRTHYLLIPLALSIWGIVVALFGNAPKCCCRGVEMILIVGTGLLILSHSPYQRPQPNVQNIRFLETLRPTAPVRMLEAEGGYCFYMPYPCERVRQSAKHGRFADLLSAQDINMIVVTPRLASDARYRDDPDWQSFLRSPESFGFVRWPVERASCELFVKINLLKTGP